MNIVQGKATFNYCLADRKRVTVVMAAEKQGKKADVVIKR